MTVHPQTPDGRYFVVRGRLWRCTNPNMDAEQAQAWTRALMQARRAVRAALLANDASGLVVARANVHAAKCALGERGPAWWTDNAPDYNRNMVRNTPYNVWYEGVLAQAASNVVN